MEKNGYLFMVGLGFCMITLGSIITQNEILRIIFGVINFIGVMMFTMGLIFLYIGYKNEKDKLKDANKQISNPNKKYLKSMIIIILCILSILLNAFKYNFEFIIISFLIVIMAYLLFRISKIYPDNNFKLKEVENYIDSRATVLSVQLSLIIIFVAVYGFLFYNLYFYHVEPNQDLFILVYITTSFILLVEIFKVIFTKLYQ